MNKKPYISPQAIVVEMTCVNSLLSGSNQLVGTSIDMNPGTMEEGDGGDAAARSRYSLWDDL